MRHDILYHGTDIKGYEEILKTGIVKPVKRGFMNFPYYSEDNVYYLTNGETFNPNETGNPFFLTPQKWYAMAYGSVVMSIPKQKLVKLYENKISGYYEDGVPAPQEFYTFDYVPVRKFHDKNIQIGS